MCTSEACACLAAHTPCALLLLVMRRSSACMLAAGGEVCRHQHVRISRKSEHTGAVPA
jgi:hypothetical protein